MRIGFDAKRAAQNATGLGNYSRFVIQSLAGKPGYDLRLYVPDPRKTALLRDIPHGLPLCYPQGAFWKRCRPAWRSWGVTRDLQRDGVELYHGLSNELPFNIRKASGIRSVVTIHDLISVKHPEYFPFPDARIYAFKIRKACRDATRVIAVSENTKADIVSCFGIPARKVDVVYQGCHPQFQQAVDERKLQMVKEKYRLPSRYVFYLGSIETRKNLLLVAKALPFLPESVSVVAVGKRTPYAAEVEEFLKEKGLCGRMRILHAVPFEELPAFYHLASVFVYPSRYEGFGIPLLEALFCQVPVIGATGSCLEEAGGPGSLYVHPDDCRDLARKIAWVMDDGEKRARMIASGLEHARNFTDSVLTGRLEDCYRKAMGD